MKPFNSATKPKQPLILRSQEAFLAYNEVDNMWFSSLSVKWDVYGNGNVNMSGFVWCVCHLIPSVSKLQGRLVIGLVPKPLSVKTCLKFIGRICCYLPCRPCLLRYCGCHLFVFSLPFSIYRLCSLFYLPFFLYTAHLIYHSLSFCSLCEWFFFCFPTPGSFHIHSKL